MPPIDDFYIFTTKTPLKMYILSKDKRFPKIFRLDTILMWFKNILQKQMMFDLQNPAILKFDNDLTNIFQTQWCHVNEFAPRVLKHCQLIPRKYMKMVKILNPFKTNEIIETEKDSPKQCRSKPSHITGDAFTISQNLRDVFELLPHFNKQQIVFTMRDVCNLISTYIMSNHIRLIDKQNKSIAYVKNDPLGKAFKVNVFHRCQLKSMIRQQLQPIKQVQHLFTKFCYK